MAKFNSVTTEYIVPVSLNSLNSFRELFDTERDFIKFKSKFYAFVLNNCRRDPQGDSIQIDYEVNSDYWSFYFTYRDLARMSWSEFFVSSLYLDIVGNFGDIRAAVSRGLVVSQDPIDSEFSRLYLRVPTPSPFPAHVKGSLVEPVVFGVDRNGIEGYLVTTYDHINQLSSSCPRDISENPLYLWVYHEALCLLPTLNYLDYGASVKVTFGRENVPYQFEVCS